MDYNEKTANQGLVAELFGEKETTMNYADRGIPFMLDKGGHYARVIKILTDGIEVIFELKCEGGCEGPNYVYFTRSDVEKIKEKVDFGVTGLGILNMDIVENPDLYRGLAGGEWYSKRRENINYVRKLVGLDEK